MDFKTNSVRIGRFVLACSVNTKSLRSSKLFNLKKKTNIRLNLKSAKLLWNLYNFPEHEKIKKKKDAITARARNVSGFLSFLHQHLSCSRSEQTSLIHLLITGPFTLCVWLIAFRPSHSAGILYTSPSLGARWCRPALPHQ